MKRHDPTLLETQIAGILLRNPVLLAAGTAGYVDEMAGVLDLSGIGGVVTKSITADPRKGNETWRVVPVRGGDAQRDRVGQCWSRAVREAVHAQYCASAVRDFWFHRGFEH